jgi:hypothetical protein
MRRARATSGFTVQYDVSADGQSFLMIRPVGGCKAGQLILVQNFSR